jgi:hypothetical protein
VSAQLEGEPQAVFGQCEIEVGDVPTKAQAIEAFLAATHPAPPSERPTDGT